MIAWISPMVFVPKSNNDQICICIDMRAPKKAINQTRYLTSILDDIMFKLKDARIFLKLEFQSSFLELELTTNSRYITTFQTKNCTKIFTRLNFVSIDSVQKESQHATHKTLKDINSI